MMDDGVSQCLFSYGKLVFDAGDMYEYHSREASYCRDFVSSTYVECCVV